MRKLAVKSKLTFPVLAACSALATAGCGGGGPVSSMTGPKGIFTNTHDCASHKDFEFKQCSQAIRAAIKLHNDDSPVYDSLRICEAKERSCERTLNQKYRPRLLGFIVELDENGEKDPVGRPLYAAVRGEKGLRDIYSTVYLETDLTLEFSPSAVAAYKLHSGGAQKGGFGT